MTRTPVHYVRGGRYRLGADTLALRADGWAMCRSDLRAKPTDTRLVDAVTCMRCRVFLRMATREGEV